MCQTKKCKYECRKGLCTIRGRIPDDALCMQEEPEEYQEEPKETRHERSRDVLVNVS